MKSIVSMIVIAALVSAGCSSESTDDAAAAGGQASSGLPEALLLDAEPAGAEPLASVKQSAKQGDAVKFQARIGGRAKPFVDGRAVMVVIDRALPSCADNKGDLCPVPWDFCCETQETILSNTATVQFVDDSGKPLKLSVKGQHGLEELAAVTVVGKVESKDDSGQFVVNATGIYVGS